MTTLQSEPGGSEPRRVQGRFLLLALALAGGFAVISTEVSLSGRPPPVASRVPAAIPAPFPIEPPTTDRPLLWFMPGADQDPRSVRLRAADWSGREAGSLSLRCLQPCGAQQSPDGRRFMLREQTPVGAEQVPGILYGSSGRLTGLIDERWAWAAIWADDSRHICVPHVSGLQAPTPGSTTDVELVDADGGSSRLVARLAGPPQPGPGGWQVLACSVTTDRMVVSFLHRHC